MDVQNVNLQTALHLAVERQHTQIVRVCIQTLIVLLFIETDIVCIDSALFCILHVYSDIPKHMF